MEAHPKKILVRAPNWIGDQILAYPFFRLLRESFPQASVTVACVPWVETIQFRDLVDHVFVLEQNRKMHFLNRFLTVDRSARQLRDQQGPFDLGFSLPNSFSAAWFLFRAGAVNRRGYSTEMRRPLLNEALSWDSDPNRHRAQAYLDLLPETGRLSAESFWKEFSDFPIAESWKAPRSRVIAAAGERYYIVAPGATATSRRWPVESFCELIELIFEETQMKAVIVGGPKELPLGEYLVSRLPQAVVDHVDAGPLPELATLFERAKFTICNESGLAHVASLCGSDVQIICGAADPRRTRPLGPGRVQVQVNPVECWPCERNFCHQPGDRRLQCLKGIEAKDVWREIKNGFE